MESYIRFDWAMKRLLRNKANYAVLEVHIPEHTRSLSGSLLGYKTIP